MLDGVTAYNELRAAERAGVRGTAMWRLGTEDPSMWDIWDATHADDATRAKLQEVPAGYDIIQEGDGDIWRITATPTERPPDIRLRFVKRRDRRRELSELSAFVANSGTGSGAEKSCAHI